MLSRDKTERSLQKAGILLLFGVLVEAFCMLWTLPIAFIVFVGIGALSLLAGVAYYLRAVLARHQPES